MKKNSASSRKLRYGGVTAALTVTVLAVVILVNVIFSAFANRFLWYVDMTPDLLYSVSDECYDLLRNGDEKFANSSSPIEMVDKIRAENKAYNQENGLTPSDSGYRNENLMINIIFCDDLDVVQSNASLRYVYYTAQELALEFSDYIQILNHNIIRNPSAVDKYLTNSQSTIATTNVIVECGTEYRVFGIRSFFTFNTETDEEPWAYNGEKRLAAGILAVTRAETPLACLTVNHGEDASINAELIGALGDAGFMVDDINLEEEEIPEDCRLLVVYNPTSDFQVNDGRENNRVNEIQKVEDFLDATNSMMVFMSPNSDPLPRFEELLSTWGIGFSRQTDATGTYPYRVKDTSQSYGSDGFTFKAEYVDYGAGGSMTADMRKTAYPRPVIFRNAMPIHFTFDTVAYQNEETTDSIAEYFYGDNGGSNGTYRRSYDLFLSSENAVVEAGGSLVGAATKDNRMKLMTVSVEARNTQEDNYSSINQASYVIACGSANFTDNEWMQNSYGNNDLMLSACRLIGQEPVPVGLTLKPFADYEIDDITSSEMTQYTVVLATIPAVLALGAGIFVLVRRKNR